MAAPIEIAFLHFFFIQTSHAHNSAPRALSVHPSMIEALPPCHFTYATVAPRNR